MERVLLQGLADTGCEGCGEPVYLTRGFGYSHCDTTLNVRCDARPNPNHPSVPKSASQGLEDAQVMIRRVETAEAKRDALQAKLDAILKLVEPPSPYRIVASPLLDQLKAAIREAVGSASEDAPHRAP